MRIQIYKPDSENSENIDFEDRVDKSSNRHRKCFSRIIRENFPVRNNDTKLLKGTS